MASQCGWWERAFALPNTEPFLHTFAWKLMDYEGPDSAVEKVCCNRGIAKTTFFSPECVPEWVVSGTPFLSGTVCGTRFAPFFCPKTKDLSDNIKKSIKIWTWPMVRTSHANSAKPSNSQQAPLHQLLLQWQWPGRLGSKGETEDQRPKTKGYDKNTSKPWSSVLLLLAGNLPIKGTINLYLYFMVYSCIFTEARTSIYRFYAYRSQKSLMLLHRCTPCKNTWAWTCSCGKLEGNDSILF